MIEVFLEMLHVMMSIVGQAYIIAIVSIIVTLLLVLYLYKARFSTAQDESPKKRNDFKIEETKQMSEQKENPKKSKDDVEQDIIITEFESDGMEIVEVYDDLCGDVANIDDSSIKKIFKKREYLFGLFLIEDPDKRLITKDLNYELISQKELRKKEKPLRSIDISELEIEVLVGEPAEFLVDDYDNVYLETENDIRRISSENVKREEVISKAKRWIKEVNQKEEISLEVGDFYKESGVFKAEIIEKERGKCHSLTIEDDSTVQEYRSEELSSKSDQNLDRSDYTELPFSHGIEVELQVVEDDWSWIDGKQMSIVFEEILDDVVEKIAEVRSEADPLVREKWSGITEIKKDDKGYESVQVKYKSGDKKRCFSVLGKDSHVSLKTNILEIQTPPCRYLEELRWWSYNIYRIAHEVVEELDIEANLISMGINPVEKYLEGVSFGEHHHIGIEDEKLRKKVYNLYRYLEPHLISLTANSPFSNGKTPNYAFNERENLVITEPSYSMRLKNNVEQFRTPPYLPSDKEKDYFKNELGLDSDSARMVDIYPFTRFGTIEMRIFDTQLCTIDRISIAVLLQTLALYVKGKSEDIDIPDISSDILKENRKEAIENGLLGKISTFKPDNDHIFETQENRYFYESWRIIIEELWPYLKELGLEDSSAVTNLMLRLYSYEDISVEPPVAPAQLILLRDLDGNSEEEVDFLEHLKESSFKAAEDKMKDLWPVHMDISEIHHEEIEEF